MGFPPQRRPPRGRIIGGHNQDIRRMRVGVANAQAATLLRPRPADRRDADCLERLFGREQRLSVTLPGVNPGSCVCPGGAVTCHVALKESAVPLPSTPGSSFLVAARPWKACRGLISRRRHPGRLDRPTRSRPRAARWPSKDDRPVGAQSRRLGDDRRRTAPQAPR